MTSRRLSLYDIINRMRNIYNTYRLCKNIERNMEVHTCDKGSECQAHGETGTMKFVDAEKIVKRIESHKDKTLKSDFVNWLRFHTFAEHRGYITNYWCSDNETTFTSITDKGIELTDNLLIPFTPVGLWKEIWIEHKVVIGLLYSLILGVVGGGFIGIIKLIERVF